MKLDTVKLAIASAGAAALISLSPAVAQAGGNGPGGFFGKYIVPDGTQAYQSRAIAGASPNLNATFLGGVRCSYRYVVQGGQRVRYEVCE